MFSVLSVVTKTYCRCQDASGDDTHLQDKDGIRFQQLDFQMTKKLVQKIV